MNIRSSTQTEHETRNAVYLDYAATTPVDPDVVAVMVQYLGPDGIFGNAASRTHQFGRSAEKAVEKARDQVAELINADPSEIVWTSGATESINLAIKGVAHGCADRGRHLVTSSMEHKAVLDSCRQLVREGFKVTYVSLDQNGLVTPECVERALRDDTIFVSLMHVNNEVGTVTDVCAISEITRDRDIAFHVDATQSVARLPLDVNLLQADLISFSGHKMYGPKGVGALYVRRKPRVKLEPQMHGGNHEHGIRSGTLATHQLVGMGEAANLIGKRRHHDAKTIAALDTRLFDHLTEIENTFVNGSKTHRISGIVNVGFSCVESESLMMSLKDVAISSGSACTSSNIEASHVLRSLGLSDDLAKCSVRFSLGRFTTVEEVDFSVTCVKNSVDTLRQLSSQWRSVGQADYAKRTLFHDL